MSTSKRPSSSSSKSSDGKHVGGNAFPDSKPVCQPCAPGRKPKPVGGMVHPGFPKTDSAYAQKKPTPLRKTPVVGGAIRRSDQNDDLYRPAAKTKSLPKKSRP